MSRSPSASSLTAMHRSSSTTHLDLVREVTLKKEAGEYFGCELVRVGQSVFVTLIRRHEAGHATSVMKQRSVLTPAYRAGLDFGDELLNVNGVDTNSLPIENIFEVLTEASTVHLAFRAQARQIMHMFLLQPGESVGMLIKENQIVTVKPGSASDLAGLRPGQAVVAVNGKSTVGLSDAQQGSIIVKEMRASGGQEPTQLTVMPYSLYAKLLPALQQAMGDFAIVCSPSFLLDNSNVERQPAGFVFVQGNNISPQVTPTSFRHGHDSVRIRSGSNNVSAYMDIQGPAEAD